MENWNNKQAMCHAMAGIVGDLAGTLQCLDK